MATNIEELFPEAGNTQQQNEIDQLRREIMAGGHRDEVERPEQEPLPASLKEVETKLVEVLTFQKELEEKAAAFKQQLLEEMQKNGIKSWKSDRIIITRILSTEKETFDSKRFKAEQEDLYRQYIRTSTTKESLKLTLRNS